MRFRVATYEKFVSKSLDSVITANGLVHAVPTLLYSPQTMHHRNNDPAPLFLLAPVFDTKLHTPFPQTLTLNMSKELSKQLDQKTKSFSRVFFFFLRLESMKLDEFFLIKMKLF